MLNRVSCEQLKVPVHCAVALLVSRYFSNDCALFELKLGPQLLFQAYQRVSSLEGIDHVYT